MNHNTGPHIYQHNDNYFGYDSDVRQLGPVREDTVPFLDLEELRKEERSSERTSIQIYKLILAKSHEKIRRTNKTSDHRMCYYDIPHFLPGYPVFDINAAKTYVAQQLYRNGIYVEDAGPSRLFLSWRPSDVNLAAYHYQSQKRIQKDNVYKIEVSPLDERNNSNATYDKPKINRSSKSSKKSAMTEEDIPVKMIQYDSSVADMVPVNAKKVPRDDSRGGSRDEMDEEEPEEKPKHRSSSKRHKHKSSHHHEEHQEEPTNDHYFTQQNGQYPGQSSGQYPGQSGQYQGYNGSYGGYQQQSQQQLPRYY